MLLLLRLPSFGVAGFIGLVVGQGGKISNRRRACSLRTAVVHVFMHFPFPWRTCLSRPGGAPVLNSLLFRLPPLPVFLQDVFFSFYCRFRKSNELNFVHMSGIQVQFFLNAEMGSFPLYFQAVPLITHADPMVSEYIKAIVRRSVRFGFLRIAQSTVFEQSIE